MRLSASEAAAAAQYNANKAQLIGWTQRYAQVITVLGFDRVCPSGPAFAQALAEWQAAHPPLDDDGKLGTKTWGRLEPHTRFSIAGASVPAWLRPTAPSSPGDPPPSTGEGPLWLQIAQAQRERWNAEISSWGDRRKAGRAEQYLDWDEQYFAAAPMWGGKTHAPGTTPGAGSNLHWCAAFVNFCLHSAGYSHTGSAGAGSFIVSGCWTFNALREPRKGCVTVVGNAGAAHVAFLWSFRGLPSNPGGNVVTTDMTVRLLGGNQGNRITVSTDRRRLLAARGSNGVTSPYLWPEVGAPTCNIALPSPRAHYCRFRTS